jgi:hypothetical protein
MTKAQALVRYRTKVLKAAEEPHLLTCDVALQGGLPALGRYDT